MKTLLLAAVLLATPIRDFGQWGETDPSTRQWFQALMQPDNPYVSCCGEADAYYSDSYELGPNGEYIAIITDERPDTWVDSNGSRHCRQCHREREANRRVTTTRKTS